MHQSCMKVSLYRTNAIQDQDIFNLSKYVHMIVLDKR